MAGRSACTIYVGNLPLDVKEWEIEDLFYKMCFHHILRDTVLWSLRILWMLKMQLGGEMAIILMDAVSKLNLLMFRVVVCGLPSFASWKDLKDHMQNAGDVCFAEVYRDGDVVSLLFPYLSLDDLAHIRKLDDSDFQNPFSKAYIRVESYDASPHGAGCQNQSRSPSRSPRSNLRSLSKSRSPPPARLSVSRSRSN
ncbi:hypothetical protein SLE2022_145030 [Rubroshorea leprosula]